MNSSGDDPPRLPSVRTALQPRTAKQGRPLLVRHVGGFDDVLDAERHAVDWRLRTADRAAARSAATRAAAMSSQTKAPTAGSNASKRLRQRSRFARRVGAD